MDKITAILDNINIRNLLDIFDFQIAIAVLIFFVLIRGPFAKLIINIYYKIIGKERKATESSMYKYLTTLSVLIGILIATNILPVTKQVLFVMNKIIKIIMILFITKCLTTLTYEDSILMKKINSSLEDKPVNKFVAKIIRGLLWIIAIFIVIYELGYNLNGLVAGLGVGAAVISFAAQDIVKSLIGGMAILTDKPFVIGDWIECGDYQGTVIDITYRSTRIKSYNNAIVTIPNSIITTNYVLNWNKLSSRRVDITLGLSMNENSEKIRKFISQLEFMLRNHRDVIKDSVNVNFIGIGDHSFNILSYFYVKEVNYAKFLRLRQDILCEIINIIDKENIELAYPTQSILLEQRKEREV